MVPRGSGRRVALVTVVAGLVVVASVLLAYRSPRPTPGPADPASSSLTLDLPGPINACSVLNPSASATTTAILDLVRPSAFLTGPTDILFGEGGAIASAELVSLHPETVVYTVDPKLTWSDGHRFSVRDLVAWWHAARAVPSIADDGYRHIASMVVGKKALSVTAVFSHDFADWNLLFRDVNEAGVTSSCDVGNLTRQPSLGPYDVESASTSRVVLISNPQWTANYNRFHRVIIVTDADLSNHDATYFVRYSPVATRALVDNLVAHPRFQGRFGNSSDIEEMTFSPHDALTANPAMRTALSWLLDRRQILAKLFGTFTFTPAVPTSALFSQGQFDYPPRVKGIRATSRDAALVSANVDCRSCAETILRRSGYQRTGQGWRDASGATLSVIVAVGPSSLDHATAALVEAEWETLGVEASELDAATEVQAASMAAAGTADVALFERPTSTTPWWAGRSWDGPGSTDAYTSGVTPAKVNSLFQLAQSTFNPATADLSWLKIDQLLLHDFWVRPLYTVPSLTVWSQDVANVVPSLSLNGLVDQVSDWGITPATATSTTSTVG